MHERHCFAGADRRGDERTAMRASGEAGDIAAPGLRPGGAQRRLHGLHAGAVDPADEMSLRDEARERRASMLERLERQISRRSVRLQLPRDSTLHRRMAMAEPDGAVACAKVEEPPPGRVLQPFAVRAGDHGARSATRRSMTSCGEAARAYSERR